MTQFLRTGGYFLALLILTACGSKKAMITEEIEIRNMDTLTVSAEKPVDMRSPEEFKLPVYNAAADREIDLLHTKLDLRFDWENEQVIGVATLKLKPYFFPASSVTLDAKGFRFNKVALASGRELKYDYNNEQITIQLDKQYTRAEEINLMLDYVATPAESGGSAAITSDKGLFFIDPRDEDKTKPTQIWTQGETEHNSRWFPTVDKPNERMTQEIYLTVDNKYKTLSNGTLVRSTPNADGTRTDYWKQDDPHAPYLVMLTIGEFEIIEDEPWRGKPVNYYLEKEYAPYAKNIFPYTREMLEMFSNQLGVEYPWDKYSQVVVRDYVSGAMENTSAVIFGEFMHGSDRDLIDNLTNEKIVAHEMYHHWFGDLVTTENWANLTLNEGFANYSEYLWLEKQHGRDEADNHRYSEMQGYLQSAASGIHPLIHYGYGDKEEMFDAHSYNKGGLVLHMLRTYLNDEAFFASLQKYLKDNQYTDVEVDELRLAFEDVTGLDLQWFFNQWFLEAGHPELTVSKNYNMTAGVGMLNLTVEQTQDAELMPAIFILPTQVKLLYANGQSSLHEITINERKQSFDIKTEGQPVAVIFDAQDILLAEVELDWEYNEAALLAMAGKDNTFINRIQAIQMLAQMEEKSPEATAVLTRALDDNYHVVRRNALNALGATPATATKIQQLAERDPHSSVRGSAVMALAASGDKKHLPIITRVIDNDRSYAVIGEALAGLVEVDMPTALEYARKLEATDNQQMLEALSDIYKSTEDTKFLAFYETKWDDMSGYSVINFLNNYAELAALADDARIEESVAKLSQLAKNMDESPWRRFAATRGLDTIQSTLAMNDGTQALIDSIRAEIEAVKKVETNTQLTNMYGRYPTMP